MPDVSTRDTSDGRLRDLLYSSPLPLGLLDLRAMVVVDANDAARSLLGVPDRFAFPVPLRSVLLPEDQAPAVRALRLVADGTINSYDARRRFRRVDGVTVPGRVWVRALGSPSPDMALVVLLPENNEGERGADDITAVPPTRLALGGPVVVGSFDAGTRISQVSADTKSLLGTEPEALLGQAFVDLVHPDDIGTVLAALGSAISADAGVGVRVRVRRASGDYIVARAVVTPVREATRMRFGFVLTPDAPPGPQRADRIAELEQHLWRIAAEVQAAGVVDNLHRLPDNAELPGLARLSTRQWQVLSELMRGERVPDIARAMFVSQSTVRNHLANIFRALGVHSQSELLALLRRTNQRNV